MTDLSNMGEKERAAYYQAHRDPKDLEEVDSPVQKGKGARLSTSITVRFSPDEADIIRGAAKAGQCSYSNVVRAAVRQLAVPAFAIHWSSYTVPFVKNAATGTFFEETDFTRSSQQLSTTGQPRSVKSVVSKTRD